MKWEQFHIEWLIIHILMFGLDGVYHAVAEWFLKAVL